MKNFETSDQRGIGHFGSAQTNTKVVAKDEHHAHN